MTAFSECFTMIKNRRNLTGAEIAEMCDKDTSMVFHWLSGKRYPKDWNQMEDIVEKLKLSDDEYHRLKDAYERTVLGEQEYTCHKKIIDIFHILEERRDEYLSFQEEGYIAMRDARLPDFVKLNNKMEILGWLQNALDYLSVQKERKLYLKFQNMHEEILMLLKLFCSRTKNCKIEEIVYLLENENTASAYNLDILKGIIEILVQRNAIEIFCQKELNYEHGFAENWIISENFILQYNADLTIGMLSTNPEWIVFFRESFESLKQSGRSFGRKNCEFEEFNDGYRMKNTIGYSIEYMPCIGNCLTEELLEEHIYQEVPNRQSIIQGILQNHAIKNKDQEFQWYSLFSRDGLIDFMETGRIENFPYRVYKPLDLKTRCEIIENGIHNFEDGRFWYYMVKDGELPVMKNLYIEQMANGEEKKLVIDMHFEEGMKERFLIKDEGLQEQFWNFFTYLEKGGYVYSAEETLAYMKKVCREYQKLISG